VLLQNRVLWPLFNLFVRLYERIRYAESESDQEKRSFFGRFLSALRTDPCGSRKTREPRPCTNEEGIAVNPGPGLTLCSPAVSSLVLIIHLSATAEEFSRYNIGWNGTSDFFSTLDRHTTRDITSPETLQDTATRLSC